jgi:hypothetical protein
VLRIFKGEKPATVKKELINLEDNPGLLCKPTWTCDLYLYILGLENELLDARSSAIEAYLSLWWDYSKSPFTTMARLKLEGVGIPATPTITPTRTATASPNPTTTPSGTPATATQTTPTITLLATETPTLIFGTPYPGQTVYPTITLPYPLP